MFQSVLKTLGVLAFAFVLVGCGGSGGDDGPPPPPPPVTRAIDIAPVPQFNRFVSNFGDLGEPTVIYATLDVIGRGFGRFSLADIPAGAAIDSARLVVEQATAAELALGALVVEHVRLGSSVAVGDYWRAAQPTVFTGTAADRDAGVKTFDVTAAVAADRRDGVNSTDFRYRFERELPGHASVVLLAPSKLVVTYTQ